MDAVVVNATAAALSLSLICYDFLSLTVWLHGGKDMMYCVICRDSLSSTVWLHGGNDVMYCAFFHQLRIDKDWKPFPVSIHAAPGTAMKKKTFQNNYRLTSWEANVRLETVATGGLKETVVEGIRTTSQRQRQFDGNSITEHEDAAVAWCGREVGLPSLISDLIEIFLMQCRCSVLVVQTNIWGHHGWWKK
jgi:hypothetical protein